MNFKKDEKILNVILIFILLQPFFDILSFLYLRGYISLPISTYAKPLIIFGLTLYILVTKHETWHKWGTYLILYVIYCVCHFFLLHRLAISAATVIHEMRFLVNTGYMMCLVVILWYEYGLIKDKAELYKKFKTVLLFTMCIYGLFMIVSVLTGTSALTYEVADPTKLGYKGWFDSGQILGHAMSISLAFMIVSCYKWNQKWYIKYSAPFLLIVPMWFFGTKTPYFMTILVPIALLIAYTLSKIMHKEKLKLNFIFYLLTIIIASVSLYQFLPVSYNVSANDSALRREYSDYTISDDLDGSQGIKYWESYKNKYAEEYYGWNKIASQTLHDALASGKVRPADTRKRELIFNKTLWKNSTIEYKLFGIGYLNQSNLSLESDILMSFYCFGIVGSLLMLFFISVEYFKAANYIIDNLKKIDLETYALFIGTTAFIAISIKSGYTFIYTNFSIFLVSLMFLLKIRIREINGNPVMFISSTGGHLSELLKLNKLYDKYDYSLITEYDKTTKGLKNKYKNVNYLVYGTKDHLFVYIFKFLWNILKSFYLYAKYRPKVIVTTGTHTAVPMCYIGHFFGSKVIFIETFANSKTRTLSGRMVYPIADTFVVQWPEMKKLYPKAEVWGWIY